MRRLESSGGQPGRSRERGGAGCWGLVGAYTLGGGGRLSGIRFLKNMPLALGRE